MQRDTYEEQGLTFTRLKTSPHNRKRLARYLNKRAEKIDKRHEVLEEHAVGNFEDDLPDVVNMHDMYWDIFCMLTEGPHDELDREHFDEKLGERVLSDFSTQATRTLLVQQGLLPPTEVARLA